MIFSYLLAFVVCVRGDTYMLWPRGSNNRNNEQSANRANANRMFDSQNNNRGGFNVGDVDAQNGFQNNAAAEGVNDAATYINRIYDPNEDEEQVQYNMMFMEGSAMHMTWTSQHGCGNAKNNCNMQIQWTCDTEDYTETNWNSLNKATGMRVQLKNGANTGTPNDPNNANDIQNTWQNNNNNNRGRHESEEFYYFAKKRERNQGLFTADQNLKGTTQIYTRQNPNGNRRGLEVPEERDYYPWNWPSIWRDIAWIGNDVDYCNEAIAPESMNVKEKYTCISGNTNNPDLRNIPTDDQIAANNEEECEAANGVWYGVKHNPETGENQIPGLDCQRAAWSQVNNLGNADGSSLGGQQQGYMWTVPTAAQLEANGCHKYNLPNGVNGAGNDFYFRLAVRNRYNISTMDYDPYNTFAEMNQNLKEGILSPIQQNPTVDTGAHMQGLRLAINTAQTGRVFQDRSHVFTVMAETEETANARNGNSNNRIAQLLAQEDNLLNVNVRGKRGNIVQTFPAVEYDFEPNDITMEIDQCLHFQWTGSNTHNNGNPAGDGQAGDAGEGRGGSDRSNIVELGGNTGLRGSYPQPYDTATDTFLDSADCKFPLSDTILDPQDAKLIMASGGYYTQEQGGQNTHAVNQRDDLDPLLNNVSASFRQGLICCPKTSGEWFLVSTRNNNFSNRAQKLHIVAKAKEPGVPNAAKWKLYNAVTSVED